MRRINVRAVREKIGHTQGEFAKRIGVGRRSVQRWESDATTEPRNLAAREMRRLIDAHEIDEQGNPARRKPHRVKLAAMLLAICLTPGVGYAQQETIEVRSLPDAISWATAAVNPSVAVYKAIRSPEPICQLSRLLVAEGIGNGLTFFGKRFITSPRPAAGLMPDGMPSGHSMNSVIGIDSTGWALGGSFAIGTGALRVVAQRHTKTQVVMGLLLGGVAEWASYRIVKCAS